MKGMKLPVAGSCCQAGSALPVAERPRLPSCDQPFVSGRLVTPVGQVPRVAARLDRADQLGRLRVRLGIRRMNYAIEPGLYALGRPDPRSPVLVTANYKLSFDLLRRELVGLDCWILVLDSKGINVWCAAGKGTFGTEELVARIAVSGLERVVEHRTIIVPQLGAPGIAAHEVRRRSGFRVLFGPVMARDLPAFIASGNRATPQMRRKRFPVTERAAVIGVELATVLKYAPALALVAFFLPGLGFPGDYWSATLVHGTYGATAVGLAVAAGVLVAPLLLPWLPGPAFSGKGWQAGLMLGLPQLYWRPAEVGMLESLGWLLMLQALAAFLAMNFTGASTFTSLSGVRKEMRLALPLQVGGALAGLIILVVAAVGG